MTSKQPVKGDEAKGHPNSGREQTEAVLEEGMPPKTRRSDPTEDKAVPEPKRGKAK